MSENFNIRIFQPLVPEYRVALYEGLGRKYGDRLSIHASQKWGANVSCRVLGVKTDYSHKLHQMGPLFWQSGFSLAGLSRGDVIVVCGDIHHLSSLWIAVRAKIRGVRVVWWGHHVSALAKPFRVRFRLVIARCLSNVFLCYVEPGIYFLKNRGFKCVFATGNTIDLESCRKHAAEFQCEKNGRTLLFCGVMREKTRVDVLLGALARLKTRIQGLKCVLIGGGEMLEKWKELAHQLGIGEIVEWMGEIRGQERLAPYFCQTDVFVYPGRIGLSLIHAFAYGLPVVLNDNVKNHGPEYAAFEPGVNGWAFSENDEIDMAEKIEEALNDPFRVRRGIAGRNFVFENYSMDKMVLNYSRAIECAAAL